MLGSRLDLCAIKSGVENIKSALFNSAGSSGIHGTSSAFAGPSPSSSKQASPYTLPPNLSSFDPLAGCMHRDYTRNNHGYISYSPRNMLDAGAIGAKHSMAPEETEMTLAPAHAVNVAHMQAEIVRLRKASRSFPQTPHTLDDGRTQDPFRSSPNIETWLHTSVYQGGKNVDPQFRAPASHGYDVRNSTIDPAVVVHRSARALRSYIEDSSKDAQNMMDRRSMYQLHGYRDKEEFEHSEKQKYAHTNFDGYAKQHSDVGKAFYYADQPKPLVPPANYQEASKQVGGGETHGANIPLLSTDLSEHFVAQNAQSRRQEIANQEKHRSQEFGLGRQGPLVRDGGPDQRTFQRGKNDERYLTASSYYANAYRGGMFGGDPEPSSPYGRRRQLELQLKNEFDVDRRTHNIVHGKYDPFDSQHEWLGVPIKTQIDDKVRMRRGAIGERSFEFFKPFPTSKQLQLQSSGTDVHGMPILAQWRNRASKEEWGLFLRYREHWYQRRRIALRYNLEPLHDESTTERDARRRKLDNLCAATPFAEVNRTDIDVPSAAKVRAWFGASILPPPVQCPYRGNIAEPLLTIEYLRNKIVAEGKHNSQAAQTFQKIPPGKPRYELDPHTLKYLNSEQKQRYLSYLSATAESHREKWQAILRQRKFIPQLGCYAELEKPNPAPGSSEEKSERIAIILDNGAKKTIAKQFWDSAPFEADADHPNHHLYWGMHEQSALPTNNLFNYIETQDALWERRVYEGTEGWSYATARDVIKPGSVVMLMRTQGDDGFRAAAHSPTITGVWERAIVEEFHGDNFYNPASNTSLRARLLADGATVRVPLSRVLIWQFHWAHPGRCDEQTEETLRYTSGTKRYVNSRDPKGTIHRAMQKPHFLDNLVANAEPENHPYQDIKQVSELDIWQRWDGVRPDNYRRLTANDRKEYIVANYYHKFTPWDMICQQEDDQPLMFFDQNYICEETAPSHFTNQNRFWTRKRRAIGSIRNSTDEIRDFFRHVDGNVPWDKASKIQSQYENRMNNPLAVFHSPTLSAHRNKVTQLPLEMYEFDKKTGVVTGIKEVAK